jgi:NAD(P)-dependent dehydrogenase (short-subunit alcohol dehydrogenase family)
MQSPKAVLITGAARRIGRAIALHFAKQGYDIAVHYHQSEADALTLQHEIEQYGQKAVLLQQDLSVLDAIPALMQQAVTALPHLQVLVNNASRFRRISFQETTPASLTQDFAENFSSAFFLTQAFAEQVGNGGVINMLDTSITTQRGSHFGYLLAKKTLAAFTQMAAKELGDAIRVNGICLGFTLPTEGGDSRDPVAHGARIPLKKQPTLAEIAATVQMLAETPCYTGQLLMLDGGEFLV